MATGSYFLRGKSPVNIYPPITEDCEHIVEELTPIHFNVHLLIKGVDGV